MKDVSECRRARQRHLDHSLREIFNSPNSLALDTEAKEIVTAIFLLKVHQSKAENDKFRQRILDARFRQLYGLRKR